ncbi:hypothetical protein [Rhizohabitans arisaemae]|uniref:hypothetical protein n=1 Tax=Rhizohabitans arisaemae TaxID=2720610 RepID=UPI0024B22120|nr:hypothetical protein [Rhizohabitans arisaemae]
MDEGLFVLGGCMVRWERWECLACGTKYREMPEPGYRWGNIVRGEPVEIGILRHGEPERALVIVRGNEPWTVTFQFIDDEELTFDEEPTVVAQGDDLSEAVRQLCRAADRWGVRLLVNGARRDARHCQVDGPDNEHLVSFLGPDGLAPLTGGVFDPADESLIGFPDEQDHIHADR